MSKGLALGRGVALACVAGVLVFVVAMLAGQAETETRAVFYIGALAGVLAGLIQPSHGRVEAGGALAVGSLALVAGVATGFGWLEYSMIIGSALAAAFMIIGVKQPPDPWLWFRWGGVVAMILVIVLLPLILDGGPLGHDESAYAVKARSWLEGTPATGWLLHRGIGMSVYGYVILALGGSEAGLRSLGLIATAGLAVAVWALGRRMANPRVAAMASLAVVAGPALLRRSTEFLSDIPSAALLVGCMVVVWKELGERGAASYRLLWALPFAWTAFYLRYQSALALALMAAVVLILWWPKLRRSPGPVIALCAIGLVGLVPHMTHAVNLTGRPWGILSRTGGGAVRSFIGEGLVDYAGLIGWSLGGFVGPIVIVVGFAGLVRWWRQKVIREQLLFLLVPAFAQVLALGLISHGEARFIFFPLALIVVAGAFSLDHWMSLDRWTAGSDSRFPVAIAAGIAVLVAGSLALSVVAARDSVRNRSSLNVAVENAGYELREEAGETTCGVMTTYAPQITFYSGCATDIFRPEIDEADAIDLLDGETTFMVLIENGKRQPTGDALAALLELTVGPPVVVEGPRRQATVYTFAD